MLEVPLLRVCERAACLGCDGNVPRCCLVSCSEWNPFRINYRHVPECTQKVIDVPVAFRRLVNLNPHTQQLA
jgi:hypothetical protein